MEHTSLNPFVPNASVFRRPDGVFEIHLHLPGITSDLEITPFASYLLVSGRHILPGFQSEDGREAELVWSDQPCGYFGRDIQLGTNNATEFTMLESSSCQNSHATVVRFSIRQKEVSTESCGAERWATEDNSRRHVTFEASSLPHNTCANGTDVYELSASNQELPVPTLLSDGQTLEAAHNPVPVAPVSGDTSSNDHGASHFLTDFNDYHSSEPVLLPTDQRPVPIRFPDEHAGDDLALEASGEILTLPAQNASVVKELMRQKIAKNSAGRESGNAQNNNPDITKDSPQASGFTLAGSSNGKVQWESGTVPVNVPDSSQDRLPDGGGLQSPAVNKAPTSTNIHSTEESAEPGIELSADCDSRDDPSTHGGVPADAINHTLQPSQTTEPSSHQTIRGPTEEGNGIVSMQPEDDKAPSGGSEPPHKISAVGSTSASPPGNVLIPSETAVHHPATEQEVGNAPIRDHVNPTESLVDQGSVTPAPPDELVEAASPHGKPHATSQNDASTTESDVTASSAEWEDLAVPVYTAEGPRDEPADSSHPMGISTESLDGGLVKVSKERGDEDIVTPHQPPDENDSVAQPVKNVPTPTTPRRPTYAEVVKKPHVDWGLIEQANSEAPTHPGLLPEMVEFLPYGMDIPVATKMSILRPAYYAKLKDLIDGIYERFQKGFEVDKITLPRPDLEDFIHNTIVKTLGITKARELNKTDDLFSFGVDSLQGIRIRDFLQQSLELSGKALEQNVVYEHPSIEKLASYILTVQSGGLGEQSDEQQHDAMIALVNKWSAKFETHVPEAESAAVLENSHVVVLTGATGSLGVHILSQLIASPAVRKVICLSRASSHADSLEWVKQSLQTRKTEAELERKVKSYAADPNADMLGLSQVEYDRIRTEATIVIHNAWPMNLALSIGSYDEDVGGALNLINLCLKSPHARPPAFYFNSSISCRQGETAGTCDEDFSASPGSAAGTGYARSKWVVEKLCQKASEKTGMTIGVLRIGQLVGDSISGAWNETEAWPLMFKGAETLGALPSVDEHPSWLPVDYAGRAISEVVLQQDPPSLAVYHIVNPNTVSSWNDVFDGLKKAGLKFDVVDRMKWLERLAESDQDPQRNPVIKLLPFFRLRYTEKIKKPIVFLTDETVKVAPSIRNSPPLSRDLIQMWVRHWREGGFLA